MWLLTCSPNIKIKSSTFLFPHTDSPTSAPIINMMTPHCLVRQRPEQWITWGPRVANWLKDHSSHYSSLLSNSAQADSPQPHSFIRRQRRWILIGCFAVLPCASVTRGEKCTCVCKWERGGRKDEFSVMRKTIQNVGLLHFARRVGADKLIKW